MSVDVLKTVAILETSEYLRGVERMAAATESVSRASGLDRLASGMTLAGGVMVGLGAKAIQTAGQFQQMQMSLKNLTGNDRLFQNLKQFTFNTPYTTSIWADQARMLLGFGVAADQVIPIMKELGDAVTGTYGVDPGKLAQLTYAYAEMNIGFANARHLRMFATAGVNPYKSVEKYLGLTESQAANIGTLHIPGRFVNAAISQGIQDDPTKRDAQLKFMHTLAGETSNLSDAWQQLMAGAGTGALEPVAKGIHYLADEVKRLSDPASSKSLGYLLLYGGPALLAAGPILKAIGLWKQMEGAKKLAAAASTLERNAEIAKMPVLTEETAAVETATSRWGAFGGAIQGVAGKLLTFAANAGKAYLAYAALNTVKELSEMHDPAQHDREQFKTDYDAFAQNRTAAMGDSVANIGRTMVYGWKANSSKGNFERYQAEALRLIRADNSPEGLAAYSRSKPEIDDIIKNWSKVSDAHVTRMAEHLKTLVDNADAYKDSGQGVLDAQGNAAKAANAAALAEYQKNKAEYLKPKKKKVPSASAADNPLDQADMAEDRAETLMKIAGLRYKRTGAKSDHDAYNAARKTTLGLIDGEIAGLERHAAAIEHVAGKAREWLSTEKKVQSLMEKHEELESDKLDKDKRDKLDKHIATILGAGGLGEDEFLKRTGIGGSFLAGLGKGKKPDSPLKGVLQSLMKRPMVLNLHLGDKPFAQIKAEIQDSTLHALLLAVEGSNQRALYGGN